MLGNLRISSKLLIMVGLSVLGIAAVAYFGLSTLRTKLQDVVTLARQTIDLDYQASKKAGLSDAEAFEKGRALLRTLRFGKDDYFYAFNPEGVVQSHPNPNVENKNLYNAPDSDGVYFTRDQIELAAKGGGFVRYRFSRPGGNEPMPKVSYAIPLHPYNWTVGAG